MWWRIIRPSSHIALLVKSIILFQELSELSMLYLELEEIKLSTFDEQ